MDPRHGLQHNYLDNKLKVAQIAMERQMLHISIRDKVRYASIRKQTGVTDIIHKIKQAKWRWAGHVARRNGPQVDNQIDGTKRRKKEER